MTDAVTPTSGGGSTTSGTEGASGPKGEHENWTMKTTLSSMGELQKKAPKLYKMMMEGIAMQMINQMKRQQDHLKDIMRDARRAAGIR